MSLQGTLTVTADRCAVGRTRVMEATYKLLDPGRDLVELYRLVTAVALNHIHLYGCCCWRVG